MSKTVTLRNNGDSVIILRDPANPSAEPIRIADYARSLTVYPEGHRQHIPNTVKVESDVWGRILAGNKAAQELTATKGAQGLPVLQVF